MSIKPQYSCPFRKIVTLTNRQHGAAASEQAFASMLPIGNAARPPVN